MQVKLKGHSDEEEGTSSQDNTSGQKSKKAKASVAKRRKAPKSAKAAPKAKPSHDLDEGHEPLVKASDESVDGFVINGWKIIFNEIFLPTMSVQWVLVGRYLLDVIFE